MSDYPIKKQLSILVSLTALLLTACASTAPITPTYVSSAQYRDYDCLKLTLEYQRVANYIKRNKTRNTDFTASGIGFGLSGGRHGIYPTVQIGVAQGKNSQYQKEELARLFGEHDAILQSARFKQCDKLKSIQLFSERQ